MMKSLVAVAYKSDAVTAAESRVLTAKLHTYLTLQIICNCVCLTLLSLFSICFDFVALGVFCFCLLYPIKASSSSRKSTIGNGTIIIIIILKKAAVNPIILMFDYFFHLQFLETALQMGVNRLRETK